MASYLIHGKDFQQVPYRDAQGREHYELVPLGGGVDIIAVSSWREVVSELSSAGVQQANLPSYETDIDLDLSEIRTLNARLRENIIGLTTEIKSHWSRKLIGYVQSGELILFCL